MDERRLLLAVALSLLVLTAYSLLFPAAPRRLPPPGRRPRREPAAPEAAPPRRGPAPRPRPAARRAPRSAPRAVADARERRVEVGGPRLDASPSATRAPGSCPGRSRATRTRAAQPEEMVPAAGGGVRPLDLETGDGRRRRAAQGRALPARRPRRCKSPPGAPATLRFEYSDGQVEAEKSLRLPARRAAWRCACG